jgi:methylmalonyl-CoA mutase
MSAAAGGADGLTVIPFDAAYRKPDELSRRLALNTQLILRDEAYFDEVADPGAGSWYIEALTDAIGREAWKLFQQIETGGGMIHALREGLVVNTLTKSREARNAAVAQRRRVLVGTNQYPNLRETMLEQIDKPLSPERGGWVFEHIRLATERHVKQTGQPIQVLLLTLGDLKMRRARADFITNFFGIAGFAISEPPAFPKPEAAADYAAEARADLIVLCSSDPEYAVIAPAIVKRLRASRVNTPVLIAGKAGDVGLESVNIKSNAVATLTDWQKRLGVQQ